MISTGGKILVWKSNISDLINSTDELFRVAFFLAVSNAGSEISVPLAVLPGMLTARAIAIAPEPVPISSSEPVNPLFSLIIRLTSSSVSGLGISVELLTLMMQL